ncbi:MAG TPA: glycosyltransferase family 4 protein [Ohtaekwangia sp.]|nr:glycosyltransferase family 4 protein [Ohtaekwangia sp.]
MNDRLKVFTWHIHGSYLYYLSKGNFDIYIPLDESRGAGYIGRGSFPFGSNVHEVPAHEVRQMDFDCIVFQSPKNYLVDQHVLFSPAQHATPKIYLEHDPPQQSPTNTVHTVDDPDMTLVHVTHFNRLMWNNNHTPAHVIEHGVIDHGIAYTGELEKGIVVINNLATRGRRLGHDILQEVRKHVPIDIVGMNSKEVGGLGEVPLAELPEFTAPYRFFFNPIRYTSLGLSLLEAMMIGMPVVGLATTELPSVIQHGVSGFLYNDIDQVVKSMKLLLHDPELAFQVGKEAKLVASTRFNIARFTQDWEALFQHAIKKKHPYRSFQQLHRNVN